MLSCGSVSFGKRQCLAFQRVRGKGSLFSNSPAPGFAAAAARPLAGCLPAKQPGSPAPKAGWKWGFFGAQPGRTRVEEGRKVQHPTGGVPCPSTEEEPTISPSLQLYRDSPALSLSRNHCLAHGPSPCLRLQRSLGRPQTCACARTARQVPMPGPVRTGCSGAAETLPQPPPAAPEAGDSSPGCSRASRLGSASCT